MGKSVGLEVLDGELDGGVAAVEGVDAHRVGVGEVGGNRRHADTESANLRRRLVEGLFAPCQQCNVDALSRKALCNGLADPHASTGDNGGSSVESELHKALLSCAGMITDGTA